jgi:hypothetical protein
MMRALFQTRYPEVLAKRASKDARPGCSRAVSVVPAKAGTHNHRIEFGEDRQ